MLATDSCGRWRLALISGLVGCGWMGTELVAVRALAPWFGTSGGVWTCVITVVLLSGALGSLLGARASRGGKPRRMLCFGLATAAAWIAAGCAGFAPLAESLAPPLGSNPSDAAGLLRLGSFVMAVIMLAFPVLLVSMTSPLLAELGLPFGTALLASTLGGIAALPLTSGGVMNTLGPRGALAASAILFVFGSLLAPVRAGMRIPACLVLMILVPMVHAKPDARLWTVSPDGCIETDVLALRETDYQHVHLSRVRRLDGATETRLALDEGLGEFHSLRVEGSSRTGQYYDLMGIALAESRSGARVLVLGGGAGTQEEVLRAQYGDHIASIHSIEIDPDLAAFIPQFVPTRNPHDHWIAGDARRGLASTAGLFEAILLDAFTHQLALPAHLGSQEFFADVAAHLTEDGVFALNVSAGNLEGPLMQALIGTLQTRFEGVSIWPVKDSWSAVVLGTRSSAHPVHKTQRDTGGAASSARALRWSPPQSAARPLTDDVSPLEALSRQR